MKEVNLRALSEEELQEAYQQASFRYNRALDYTQLTHSTKRREGLKQVGERWLGRSQDIDIELRCRLARSHFPFQIEVPKENLTFLQRIKRSFHKLRLT